jgi:thioredoxin-related protein
MMKHLIAASCFLAVINSCSAQEEKAGTRDGKAADVEIHWLSFEDAVARSEQAPRKLFIDVYTDWCGWCKRMDKTTFRDTAVVRELNQHFYAVKLDAERKDTVRFRDNIFVYKPEYKSHELALSLLNGKMSFPTYVFLDEQFGMISPVAGYKSADDLMRLLNYFAGDLYKTMSWEEYLAGAGKPQDE